MSWLSLQYFYFIFIFSRPRGQQTASAGEGGGEGGEGREGMCASARTHPSVHADGSVLPHVTSKRTLQCVQVTDAPAAIVRPSPRYRPHDNPAFNSSLPPGMSKRTSYGKIYRPNVPGHRQDIRARPQLSRRRVFIRGRVFTVRADGKKCVRADVLMRPCGHQRVRVDATMRPLRHRPVCAD
jgi:hypothetical protein